jgi:epoxyqueuosine reductase
MIMQPQADWPELTRHLKQQASELGFSLAGVTPAATPERLSHLKQWLDNGYAGQMQYLENRRAAYEHPSHILDGCRTLLMLGTPYLFSEQQRHNPALANGRARVARKSLKRWLVQRCPGAGVRGVIDTAPLLEREFAEAAGLGWVGKNTLLLNRRWGSYFFLAALLTDLPLQVDSPMTTQHCGTCTACLDHCPTQAFVAPYVLDANRCLSYATIEAPGEIQPEIGAILDQWIFGCDICQEVCPWNRKSQVTDDTVWQPKPEFAELNVIEILEMTEEMFRSRFRSTPLWRSRRRGMVRNAALVAGAQRLHAAITPLSAMLCDQDPLLRACAAWALGQIGGTVAHQQLRRASQVESDSQVRSALDQALRRLSSTL